MNRLHRLADATSQWFNVLIFGGEANHSVSGDAWRYQRRNLERFINWLCFWERDHCYASHKADINRAKDLLLEHYEEEVRRND